jgi:hypothetical protein
MVMVLPPGCGPAPEFAALLRLEVVRAVRPVWPPECVTWRE